MKLQVSHSDREFFFPFLWEHPSMAIQKNFRGRQYFLLLLSPGALFHGYTKKLPQETVFFASHVLLQGLSQGKNDYTQKFGARTAYSFIFSVYAHNFSIWTFYRLFEYVFSGFWYTFSSCVKNFFP